MYLFIYIRPINYIRYSFKHRLNFEAVIYECNVNVNWY